MMLSSTTASRAPTSRTPPAGRIVPGFRIAAITVIGRSLVEAVIQRSAWSSPTRIRARPSTPTGHQPRQIYPTSPANPATRPQPGHPV